MSAAIIKQGIGRHGSIGSLYDIRTDRFEGGNLFNQELPAGLVSTTDCASSDYFVDENLSQKDTFNKLNVEASMKLSLMAGLIKVEGSAKYLNQTKTKSRIVRVTFMFNVRTKQQHLQVSRAELYKYFSPDALENANATHCVVGITWGAHIGATFEETLATSEAVEELQGQLAASLKKVAINISGQAKLEDVDRTNSKFHSLKISFSGDVLIEDVPNTVEDVFTIFKKVPSMLKQLNGGKGQQLEFELYPLKRMAEIFKHELRIERMIKEVTNLIMNRIENIFEQIIQGKRMMNDFLAKIEPWQGWISPDWIEVICDKQAALVGEELRTQCQLATLLEQIRCGQADEKEMVQLLDNFNDQNPCSLMSVKRFLKENAWIDAKITSLSQFDRRPAQEKNQPKEPNPDMLLKHLTSINDFILNYYDNDVYLLHISTDWEERNRANWYKQLRCFYNLQKAAESIAEAKKTIFRVIDHDLYTDLDAKPNMCVIYHARRGIKSKDDYHSSLKKLSDEQIGLIMGRNPGLKRKHILKWHNTFWKEHFGGELTKTKFVDEYKKLYPRGNPAPYCDYVFKSIDKDRTGTINFVEFMEAVAITQPGDPDSRLRLVFAICDKDGSGIINGDEMAKFVKVMAELNKEQVETETSSASSYAQGAQEWTVDEIMKRFQSDRDTTI
ncbi:unnamed protein product [Rotaria magnacalcarata]|uniref:EF-hand domain-containing protein n=1 Tax=Rotaria magnacalcarata TaxID=392030 RepID=A0A814LUF5_9BILA|nr:unnamed protein product [Rotaria magnacalcarata]CAF3779091.1 unnamed protein product [Rotaria magnacalcarata]CAF4071005.1 unnamed protein product [Rotaria magnacalcarata]CAF4072625.1 unnamed protein product [Rotaria magnacalcarata]